MTDEAMSEMSARQRGGLGGVPAQFGLMIIIAAFWAVFAWRAPGFLSPFNSFSVGRALAVDIVIGFAQMAALATGGMNLSVGSIGVCAVMTGGYLMQALALPVPVAILGALGLGAALGWLNGFVIARSGVSAFIITLASANLYSGAMLILTKAVPLNSLPMEVGAFGKAKIAGLVSPLLVIALAIGLLLFVFYRHSVLGRQILAAGANARAAKMSGVPVDRVITISHALSGLLAATAGMMVVARLGAAMPAVGGEDWLLPSFLGPVLGGTPLSGGAVAVAGTMLGALLVTTIRSGLLVLQIGNYWLQLYLGVILLLAVLVDRYRALYQERRGIALR
ncbi:MAG TPA: ABC transporter permease [Roseiarcus sp.]|jgi:ribose transport system permease protein